MKHTNRQDSLLTLSTGSTTMRFTRPIHRPIAGRLALWLMWSPQVVIAGLLLSRITWRRSDLKERLCIAYSLSTLITAGIHLLFLTYDMSLIYKTYFFALTGTIQLILSFLACWVVWTDRGSDKTIRFILLIPTLFFIIFCTIGISYALTLMYLIFYPIPLLPVRVSKRKRNRL